VCSLLLARLVSTPSPDIPEREFVYRAYYPFRPSEPHSSSPLWLKKPKGGTGQIVLPTAQSAEGRIRNAKRPA
jgi:hypothetical protein